MKLIKYISILFLILVSLVSVSAQEICNNGIDDDGNGFTDSLDVACNTCDSITQLNFEDGLLPSSHGWVSTGGSSSIVSNGSSNVLEISGVNHFDLNYDLGSLCLNKCNWTFDVDFNIISCSGTVPNSFYLGIFAKCDNFSLPTHFGLNHYHFEHSGGVYSASLNGVATALIAGGGSPSQGLDFGFGNTGQTTTIQIDNISFFHCSSGCSCIDTSLSLTACDSAQINGNWYYSSQVVNDTLNSSHSCDSIVVTNLTIDTVNAAFTGLALNYCVNATIVSLTPNTAGGIFSGSGISGSIFSPSSTPVGTDTISYVLIDGNGCKDSTSQIVNIDSLPNATFSSLAANYCLNSPAITLTPINVSGVFSGNGVGNSSFTPVIAGVGNDTIKYLLIDGNGCKDSTAQAIIIDSLPNANFSGLSANYCSNTAVITLIPINVGGTFSGSGITGTSLNPATAAIGLDTIKYILMDVNSCKDTSIQTVLIKSAPASTATHTNVLCNGDSTGTASILTSSGSGIYTYSWNTLPVQTAITAINLPTGTYTCTATDSNTCFTASTVTITQPPALNIISAHTDITCNSIATGSASVAISGGVAPYSYLWTPSSVTTSGINNLMAGNYSCTVTDSNACTFTQSIVIVQPDSINAQIISVPSCGNNNGTALITGVTGGTGNFTYNWSPSGGTTNNASGLSAGIYTCTISDSSNCAITKTITVIVHTNPTVTVSSDTTINYGSNATIYSTGGIHYTWTPATALNCDTCSSAIASPLETTTYCMAVIDTNNCTDSACFVIYVKRDCEVAVPTAFSPNGDGINETICILGSCASSAHLAIFDRWGEKIFETNSQSQCWDGTYKGAMLNSAVFVYYLDAVLIDGRTLKRKGNISLIR